MPHSQLAMFQHRVVQRIAYISRRMEVKNPFAASAVPVETASAASARRDSPSRESVMFGRPRRAGLGRLHIRSFQFGILRELRLPVAPRHWKPAFPPGDTRDRNAGSAVCLRRGLPWHQGDGLKGEGQEKEARDVRRSGNPGPEGPPCHPFRPRPRDPGHCPAADERLEGLPGQAKEGCRIAQRQRSGL